MWMATQRQINTRDEASDVTLVLPHPRDSSDGCTKRLPAIFTFPCQNGVDNQAHRNRRLKQREYHTWFGGPHRYMDDESLDRRYTF
jgi:hypothetical protein